MTLIPRWRLRAVTLVCGLLPFWMLYSSSAAPKSEAATGLNPVTSDNARFQSGRSLASDLKFAHLTTKDGLSQGYVTAILQDRRGFMWFATRDGLNRYDGNVFVVYKNKANDPGSLSSNFIQDLVEDDDGTLWIATNAGVNKFDPATERCARFLHDAKDPASIGSTYITSIARGSRGDLWFGTQDSGLDRFDARTGIFTHYRKDSDGEPVGRIARVIESKQGAIWFVGERGLFQLDPSTGRITHALGVRLRLSAQNLYEDRQGNLWMLADAPILGLVKYDPKAERASMYPFAARAARVPASTTYGGSVNSNIVADGENGLWVPSSQGLFYFDRRTERFTRRFQHNESDPNSLDSDAVLSVYQDRGGVLWVGTENTGLNLLNIRQEQFVSYGHRAAADSLSPGRVKAIYEDAKGAVWLGLFPRALDRLDRKTGHFTHYDESKIGKGANVNAIYEDPAGYLWVGGGGGGLVRLDERTGRLKHYRHQPADPNSLISDDVITVYGDRHGTMWVGQQYGLSHFDSVTGRFSNYQPVPNNPASLNNWIWAINRDRSGTLWLGTFGGALIRFDEKTKTSTIVSPDARDPRRLNGGGITSIHEDRNGVLWVGAFDGLYRFNQQDNSTLQRYTESEGLPSSTIRCILEDRTGRLWLSTQRGLSRFDPRTASFRNYDMSDGLQTSEFSDGCYESSDGEMFFGGSTGFNAFFPDDVHDNPYVPPVVITNFRIFNKPVAIGPDSVLQRSVPYVDSLTLPYRDNVFSFEFAALSYVNSQKNRYRYKLDNFETGWNEVGSQQRLATYTNLDPGKYVFRVQGSNSDGVWNEQGASLTIVITPPWWSTVWFRSLCAALLVVSLWAAHRWRLWQLRREFEVTLDARVSERTRIARELHDTLLQSFHGLLLRFQIVSDLLPGRPIDAKGQLDYAIERAAEAITEGRNAVQGLRESAIETNDLAKAVSSLAEELAADPAIDWAPSFSVTVEGESRGLHPILRDEIYRIAGEALRNAFHHAQAQHIEVEFRYGHHNFQLRVRDDGKGMDKALLSGQEPAGHFGLPGMRERTKLIGGNLEIWSEIDAGTEVELRIPTDRAYPTNRKRSLLSQLLARK